MEEKCLNAVNSIIILNTGCVSSAEATAASTSSTSASTLSTLATPPDLEPSSSRSSMSLLQEEFANSQHDFAEVLDEETTTSGVLETFEISSSNSLPTCSDVAPVDVGADDSSSTDTIKIVEVSDPSSCNNEFFSTSEVFVINDDDDDEEDVEPDAEAEDEDDDVVEKAQSENVSHGNTSQIRTVGCSSLDVSQPNGVIVTANGSTIYLETPVIEEQLYSQISNICSEVDFAETAGKPKRLSDEFQLAEDEASSSTTTAKYKLGQQDLPAGGEGSFDAQHDKMSFRLKKMHINNNCKTTPQALGDLPSSSQTGITHSEAMAMTEIESMDLIERSDFETEQRLTGGILLKSSSLADKNMLNLSLIESCIPQGQQPQQQLTDCHTSSSSSNVDLGMGGGSGRAVSSDSKCVYKDPTTTPTSSRHNSHSRLTKSTAKLNLCSTLSQQQDHPQLDARGGGHASKQQIQKSKSCNSSTSVSVSASASTFTSVASVIVEAPSTSMSNASEAALAPNGADIFSNSNSNDSVTRGGTAAAKSPALVATTAKSCLQGAEILYQQKHEELAQEKEPQQLSELERHVEEEGGCSRTSALHSAPVANDNGVATFDDAQPSTSSARCQYAPPPKSLRQVHASAQTIERYLSSRGGSFSSSTTGNDTGVNVSAAVTSVATSRNRRRTENGVQQSRSGTSEEAVAPFRAASELIVFNEDQWADCEENNSDLEEICTCHHSSSSGSSHSGSNTSLNETEELDTSSVAVGSKDGDLSNYIQMVSISEEASAASPDIGGVSFQSVVSVSASSSVQQQQQQRKRKHNESRLLDSGDYGASVINSGGSMGDANSRKRIAYDCASTPRSSQSVGIGAMAPAATPTSQLMLSASGSPLARRTPRSIIPTRDNPPPELPGWLIQFQRWSHAERLLAIDRLIAHCEPTQVRHMMKVIEPQFQRDFISLLPRELALQVLAYLEPKDLLRAAQTCRSWRFLCDDNLLWKEKCRKAQILTEPQTDRPKRGRAGNMPPIASPWKAAYMRQHIIEMNWRSRPIREPKVLKGHDDHVITCLQFFGNRIVSGSDDNTLKVWSAVTGRCLRTLVGHTGGVWSSQMSGNIIISGSTDRTLKVWDMETGQCVHTLLGHTSTVRCMHLHGSKVVSGSRDATLRVWDIELGTCLHVLVGHLAAVRCVQYDGKLIVSGAYDYMVKIWNPERQECLHTLQGHTNRVYSLQFDGLHVVSGSLDTSIRVWDVETGNCKHTLMGHQSLTSGMELRQNILVSGNADSTVKVWDITTGQCLQTLSGPNKHQSAVTCLQFNSRFVVTSSDDGTVKLWDVKTGDFIRNLVALDSGGSGGVVWRIRANDTKLICAVGSRNGTEETKLMVLDFDVEGACVKCS